MTKTFLCIGAGPGIGLETARRFGREGYRLLLASRDPGRIGLQVDELRAAGVEVVTEAVDAADGGAVTRLVEAHAADLEVLLYNAAKLGYGQSVFEQSAESIDSDIQIDISSGLRAVHAAVPAYRKQGRGTILLTGGGLADAPNALALTLSLGKLGLRAIAEALSAPLKEEGINIGCLTISARVAPDSAEARTIADMYWAMHAAPKGEWKAEYRFPA